MIMRFFHFFVLFIRNFPAVVHGLSKIQEQQQLFDISLNHIRKQGGPSASNINRTSLVTCLYRSRTYDGTERGCAAAPFITKYEERLEGRNFTDLVDNCSSNVDPVAVRNVFFVRDLQVAHDRGAVIEVAFSQRLATDGEFMSGYEDRMKRLAEQYGLVYTPPKAAE